MIGYKMDFEPMFWLADAAPSCVSSGGGAQRKRCCLQAAHTEVGGRSAGIATWMRALILWGWIVRRALGALAGYATLALALA